MKYIHPFPARMAPELALASIRKLKAKSVILDPMMGSGTVLREALINGHTAIGYDLDPLALMISKVATSPFDLVDFERFAKEVLNAAKNLKEHQIQLVWIDNHPETIEFINYWYAKPQENSIRKIIHVLSNYQNSKTVPEIYLEALKTALSRIIITKEMKASLARDTAHSRPHRVAVNNDYDVFDGFESSIKSLIKILATYFKQSNNNASIHYGDARQMSNIESGFVDTIITSPPYLNAIDYLRGHKFSLIWFGFNLTDIRNIRNFSVGIEKLLATDNFNKIIIDAIERSSSFEEHSKKMQRTILKYAVDLNAVLTEYKRVIKPGGSATFVVGNSYIKGSIVDNSNILKLLAENIGFELRENLIRQIPSQNRYLPVSNDGNNPLDKRMKQENVMTFLAN